MQEQQLPQAPPPPLDQPLPPEFSAYIPDVLEPHALTMLTALLALPLAAALGAALAFRPRRSGTPGRSASVIQTQIMLAIVGALVMLIVGSSLARAFGIVGVASLIRYRTKVDDPKDAVVMLACLTRAGVRGGVVRPRGLRGAVHPGGALDHRVARTRTEEVVRPEDYLPRSGQDSW